MVVKRTTHVRKSILYVGYALGFGVAGLAAAQMVSFEEFVEALQNYGLASYGWTVALALFVIAVEICAVPFLLRVMLHKTVWLMSAVCALLTPLVWTLLTVLAMMLGRTVANAGYAGGFVDLPVGGVALALDLLWLAVAWTWYGKMGGRSTLDMQ